MNLLSKFFKYIIASQVFLSFFFAVNFYAVFDDKSIDIKQCIPLFKSNYVELCYNFTYGKLNYCPINSKSETDDVNE